MTGWPPAAGVMCGLLLVIMVVAVNDDGIGGDADDDSDNGDEEGKGSVYHDVHKDTSPRNVHINAHLCRPSALVPRNLRPGVDGRPRPGASSSGSQHQPTSC